MWLLVSLTSLVLLIQTVRWMQARNQPSVSNQAFMIGLWLCAFPVWSCLAMGQASFFSLALTLAAFRVDLSGRFVFAGLEPGDYRFGTFYNFNGVAPRETYRTGSGKHVIQLVLPFRIKGVVVGPGGQPVQPRTGQAWVNARAGDQFGRGVIVAADGTFEIEGLPPGVITLQTYASGYLPAKVEVQAGAENVRIEMQPQKG